MFNYKNPLKRLCTLVLNAAAFNIPVYNEIFARSLGSFGVILGVSPLRIESVLRGMYLSKFSNGSRLQVGRYVLLSQGKGKISFGKNVIVNHHCYLTTDKTNGIIEIGNHSHIDSFSVLHGQGGIIIGSKCAIASGVTIYSQTNQYKFDTSMDVIDQPILYQKVAIGNGVWIGANATILPGVSIGSGAIIGAGAVVNKNIPENTIAVGVPARIHEKKIW